MSKHLGFIIICLTSLLLDQGITSQANEIEKDDRPNIVVILCDDLGYGDLECYGHPHIKTPHLNRLAAEGIRFTDFYSAAPVCSPSRVGLLTGRNPNRAGVYDWIPSAGKKSKPDAREQVHMRRVETTIPELLKKSGYATCMAGKWHCNSRFNSSDQPQPGDFGFDHWLATQNNAAPSHENPKNFVRNGENIGQVDSFSCNFVVQESIDWLKQQQDSDSKQPFFIYLPFHEPHEPVASPPDLVETYRKVAESDDQAQYFANVANVDRAVGEFLDALATLNLTENTLVIFTSDNGPETLDRYPRANRSHGTPAPLRGMKLHTHEAGFRVAGIMRWPARIQSGQISKQPVSSLDFLPTFCKLAQSELPASQFDGTSFLPVLEGKPIVRSQPLFWCYFNALNESRVAMRDGNWKVLARLDGGKFPKSQNMTPEKMVSAQKAKLTDFEIYNLQNDLSESTNLVATDLKNVEELKSKLNQLYKSLNADSHVWIPSKTPSR